MRRVLVCALAFGLLGPARARGADCPPPETYLVGVRGAQRVQMEQLGADRDRVATGLAHVPGRTLGYEVIGRFRVGGAISRSLRDAFGRGDSYACTRETPAARFAVPYREAIGIHFGTGARAVTVVLHLPEGDVEIQAEGGARVRAPLSLAGRRRWELALAELTRETHTSSEQFYRQMAPSAPGPEPGPESVPADSTPPPRDGSRQPR